MIDYIRKNIFIITGSVIILLLILNFLVLNVYYSVNIKTEQPSNNALKISYLDSDSNIKPSTPIFGVYMIPRSADIVVARVDNQESHTLVRNKAVLGVNSITINLRAQRELSKIGRGGLGCNSMDTQFKIFTYSCYGASDTIFTYADKKNNQFDNTPLSTELPVDRIVTKPYKDGLLSIGTQGSKYYLEYTSVINDSFNQQELPYISSDSVGLYTSSSDDSFIVVNNNSHEILSYSSISLPSSKLAFSKDLQYTTCSVLKFSFSCVATTPISEGGDGDSHAAEDGTAIKNSRLITYNTMTKRQSTQRLDKSVDTVCETSKGFYLLGSDNRLSFMPRGKEGDYTVAKNISVFSCTYDTVYYMNGKSIYVSSNGDSSLLFTESRLDIVGLYTNGKKVIIDVTINDEDEPTIHTYEITDTPSTSKRLESILPYPEGGIIPILEMDYDNENFYIKPQLSVISDKQTGETIVDEDNLAEVKKQIENKLKEDDIFNARKIIYYLN